MYLYAIGYLKKAKKKEELFLSYGLIILYGCFSSLVLAGFAVLFLSGVYLLYLILKKQTRSSAPKIAGGCFILASVYAMNNVELIEQVLGLEGETSHKVEMVLSPEPFTLHEFLSLFIKGQYHAASKHIFLLCVIFVVLAVALWRYKTLEYIEKKWFLGITKAVLGAAGIALFYCIFHCPMVVNWRNQLPGALKAFQLDRFYWLYPAIWFISAGLAIDLGWRLCRKFAFKIAFVGMVGCALLGTLWMCRENVLIKDMLKIISPNIIGQRLDKNNVTWKGFFAEDVFQQIENDIDPDKQSYRVISIGMYPTIPLYNGFYCLDGYSNNYPLEYKHQFYEIIKEELECDESLKKYFCEWGSRCYAFTHEVGMEYMTPKGSSTKITDLKLNLEAFSGMGGRYIFSAVEIEAHQKYGLDFIGNYVAKDSYYQIWVYEYPV